MSKKIELEKEQQQTLTLSGLNDSYGYKPKGIDQQREETRTYIVVAMIGIFALTILAPLFFNLSAAHWEFLDRALIGEVGLLGSALGFYYQAEVDKNK